MSTATTIYDIHVNYKLNDKASTGLLGINRNARQAAVGAGLLNKAFRTLSIVAAGGFGLGLAIKHTVGFNRTLAQTQAQLRTILQLNTGRSFEQSTDTAGKLMEQFRIDARQTAGTFQDMVSFSAAIAGPITQAGGSMEDLRDITKGAVVAAKAFGERTDLAQLDIRQALAGTLNAKDRFAKAVLEPLGYTAEEFNKLAGSKRLDVLKQAFNQKAIKDAAKAYETSFEGVFSTFQSQLQETGGLIGSKVFKRITVELKKITDWFIDNEDRINRFADKLADGMVTAFEYAKQIFAYIVEHRELLLTLAKAWLASKAVGGLVSGLGTVQGIINMLGKGGLAGVSALLTNQFGLLVAATGAAVIGIEAFGHYARKNLEAKQNFDANTAFIRDEGNRSAGVKKFTVADENRAEALGFGRGNQAVQKMRDESFIKNARDRGFVTSMGKINRQAIADQMLQEEGQRKRFMDMNPTFGQFIDEEKRVSTFMRQLEEALARGFSEGATRSLAEQAKMQREMFEMLKRPEGPPDITPFKEAFDMLMNKTPAKPDVKVDKIEIHVESNDPTRFVFQLEGLFADIVQNGAQAAGTLPQGGS